MSDDVIVEKIDVGGLSIPPYGAFRLGPVRSAFWRVLQGIEGKNYALRRVKSVIRRSFMSNWRGLVDVESSEGLKMRLEIEHNLPDKWYFVEGAHSSPEFRKCFDRALESPAPRVFNFIDLGANSGVISAIAIAGLQQRGVAAKVIAVEPQRALLERLAANLLFNKQDGDFSLYNCAVSDTEGLVRFNVDAVDQGKSKISDAPSAALTVPAVPLSRIVAMEQLTHIDFIKIDVEGHETKIFAEFFRNAPAELWPRYVFAELIDRGLHTLMISVGYRKDLSFSGDALFIREDAASS